MIITRNSLLALLCLLGLCACGFRLAGTTELPPQLATMQLVTSNFSATQLKALRSTLKAAGARLVEGADAQAVRLSVSLNLLPDQQLVSSAGGDIVKRISRSLDFNVKAADGNTIVAQRSLRQQKDVTLDDNNLLSSDRERETAVRGLEQALYDQLIRQLSRI